MPNGDDKGDSSRSPFGAIPIGDAEDWDGERFLARLDYVKELNGYPPELQAGAAQLAHGNIETIGGLWGGCRVTLDWIE